MIQGTDVNLGVCKNEGYTMIEFNEKEIFDKNEYYRVFYFEPEYVNNYPNRTTCFDQKETFEGLRELYLKHKEGIDNFAETNNYVNFDNPDYTDFLNLASDLIAYCGL